MKKFIKNIGILFLIVLVLGACNKWIDPDINIDPDSPAEVTMATLMPAIQARVAFTTVGGNDVVRTEAIWIQHLDGVLRQSLAEANYQLRSGDVNNLWNDVYAGSLMDIVQLIQYAESTDPVALHYRGAAKVLTALVMGMSTDVWNEMPYTEAFQGEANMSPTFDSQSDIYALVFRLLDEAIADLNADDQSGIPLDGDYLYGGDAAAWAKAAYSLKAKFKLHLSKKNGAAAYNEALEAMAMGISDNSEDMQFDYGTGTKESNPLYQFMRDRGDVRMGSFFVEMLKLRFDPRLTVFVAPDGNGEFTGSDAGSGNDAASEPGPGIAAATAPTYFVTNMEMLHLKAECQYQTGVAEATVKETLFAAVQASLEKYGVFDQTWFDAYVAAMAATTGPALLKEIMTQKYIALCYQQEAYTDWRRYDNLLEVPLNPTGFENEIPRRFPYSTDEITYNPNTPSGVLITDRVWWDD